MIQASTLKFLTNLKKNNNKAWFDAHRKEYDAAKSDFSNFIQSVIDRHARKDATIKTIVAKDCLFRINRDVRFSKDKSPYKTNMGAYINRGGKKSLFGGYYFHCEPGQSFAAGGSYTPDAADLAKIRQEIDYNLDEWNSILKNKTFKKYFTKGVEGIDVLSRPPKGYSEENPAIVYLKMKSYIVSRPLNDTDLLDKHLVKEISKTFEAMKPMIDFLNHAMQ